jgi:cysteine sulfinate desulfinase/cysteine desulfurase-like protein
MIRMMASELAKEILKQVDKDGDKEILVSVAFSNKLIGAIDNIQIINSGNSIEIRGEQ